MIASILPELLGASLYSHKRVLSSMLMWVNLTSLSTLCIKRVLLFALLVLSWFELLPGAGKLIFYFRIRVLHMAQFKYYNYKHSQGVMIGKWREQDLRSTEHIQLFFFSFVYVYNNWFKSMLFLASLIVVVVIIGLAWAYYNYVEIKNVPITSSYGIED